MIVCLILHLEEEEFVDVCCDLLKPTLLLSVLSLFVVGLKLCCRVMSFLVAEITFFRCEYCRRCLESGVNKFGSISYGGEKFDGIIIFERVVAVSC